jgi:hypothetical protein
MRFASVPLSARACSPAADAQEVFGVTTLEVVNEVSHRLMLAEAVEESIIGRPLAALLAGKHNSIIRLRRYWTLTLEFSK